MRTRIEAGAATAVGRVREHNEDAFLVRDRVFAVADGMGGHAAGEVASALAIEALARLAESDVLTRDAIVAAVADANARIVEAGSADRGRRGMGTTLTGLAVTAAGGPGGDAPGGVAPGGDGSGGDDSGGDGPDGDESGVGDSPGSGRWLVFNLGDSRVYRFADGTLEQVTTDHSEVQELVNAGVISRTEAAIHPARNIITRSLGLELDPRPDLWELEPTGEETFVVCSDGLTGELRDAEIAAVLTEVADAQAAAERLCALADEAGGRDNITVVVVRASTEAG